MARTERKGLALAIIAAVLAALLVGIGYNWLRATDPKLSLGEWESVHDWRRHGECVECHAARVDLQLGARNVEGVLMTPASFHTAEFRRYSHGRREQLEPQRCYGCHERQACDACHARLPESHTSEFTAPQGDTLGANRHVLLGRVRPSSCLVCHRSLVADCADCHGAAELQTLGERARKMLGRWAIVLEGAPAGPQAR